MSLKHFSDESDSPSVLNKTADKVLEVFKDHEEDIQRLDKRKQSLEKETEIQKKNLTQLELEKSVLEAEITMLKLRNLTYQKEHINLRNAITVTKFQIEKIKDSITEAKANEVKDLEEFEKAVDEITENFRSSPGIYDRKIILEKIQKEKERKDFLVKKMEEIKSSYEEFNKEKGLRPRKDENEDLFNCVLPGSPLYCLIEMTKNLDELISEIKALDFNMKQFSKDLQNLEEESALD